MDRGEESGPVYRDPYSNLGTFSTIWERLITAGFFAPSCTVFEDATYSVRTFSDGSNLLYVRGYPELLYDTIQQEVYRVLDGALTNLNSAYSVHKILGMVPQAIDERDLEHMIDVKELKDAFS